MRFCAVLCIAVIVVVSACNDDGLAIEIRRGSTTANHVELYAVDDYCRSDDNPDQPCPRLKTPTAPGYLAGNVYTRADARTFASEIDRRGSAHFKINANGDDSRIDLMVAVGFDGDTIVGAAMLGREVDVNDNSRVVVLELETVAEAKVSGTATSDGLRVETWYRDPQTHDVGCLALEQREQGMLVGDRTFIVPADDPDCDGFVAPLECDAFWPNYSETTAIPQLDFTCVADVSVGMGQKACMLGDVACMDGTMRGACAPTNSDEGPKYCVPLAICNNAPEGCKGGGETCAFGKLKDSERAGSTRVHCTVPVEMFNAASNVVCNGQTITYDIPMGLMVSGNPVACTGASIGPVTGNGFDPFVPVDNNVDVHVTPDCIVKLIFSEQFDIMDTRYLDNWVLRVDLSNQHSVLVPLFVEFAVDNVTCDAVNGGCELEGPSLDLDPSFMACGRLPP